MRIVQSTRLELIWVQLKLDTPAVLLMRILTWLRDIPDGLCAIIVVLVIGELLTFVGAFTVIHGFVLVPPVPAI